MESAKLLHPENLINFRYKPRKERFRNCEEPSSFEGFDWILWAPETHLIYRCKNIFPKRVLCLAHPKSIRWLRRLHPFLKEASILIAGEDTLLSSTLVDVERIASSCKKVFYEAKDIKSSSVSSFSMGFIQFYLNRFGTANWIEAVKNAEDREGSKEGVLAAWGAIWKFLDTSIEDRRQAHVFIEQSSWLKRQELSPDEYLKALVRAKYLIAPAGQGVQAPKLAEAWAMRTVPIVTETPCFRDLTRQGYPMLILKHWNELTPELIARNEERRRKVKWLDVHKKLTNQHIHHLLKT